MEEGTLAPLAADQLATLCKKITVSNAWTYACTDKTFVDIDRALEKAALLLKQKQDLEARLQELTAELSTKTQEFELQAANLGKVGEDVKQKEAQIADFTKKLQEAEQNLVGVLAQAGDNEQIKGQLDQVRKELDQIGLAKVAVEQEKEELGKQITLLTNEIEREKATKKQETQNCNDLIAELNRKLATTATAAKNILGE